MTAPLVHLVRRPAAGSPKPPLLLLLHGVGSHEGDLFSLEGAFDPGWVVVSARAPLTLQTGAYSWFPVEFTPEGIVADAEGAENSRRRLIEFLDWAVAEFGADPGRVAVAGFSQGAIMTASLALTEPEKLCAAVLMSGRILPEVLPLAAPLERRSQPRYLVIHGTQDQVLPIANGRASRQTLRSLGIEPEYYEFPMPHTISDESLSLVVDWTGARLGRP